MDQEKPTKNATPLKAPAGPPHFGAMKGEIEWQEGWEKPLSSEEADAFWAARSPQGELSTDLDAIVTKLDERKQRATYGAVAGIVGGLPRGVMNGRPPSHKDSWVVAKTGSKRGWPTGYTNEQIHPECLRQIENGFGSVIEDTEALMRWLKS